MSRNAWPARCPREALVLLLLAFCQTFATPAVAQPAPPLSGVATIPPVVVTASRTEQSLLGLLADVTWIGPDEIAASGVDSLAQLLQRQPGTEIVTTGGPGSTSGVFLRGANTDQTLVLVDGMRVGIVNDGDRGAGGDPAVADRPYRNPARARVQPVRRGRDRRGDPDLHPPGRAGLQRQRVGRLWNL